MSKPMMKGGPKGSLKENFGSIKRALKRNQWYIHIGY